MRRRIDNNYGDVRENSWFAWLPVYIGRECRWLETVTVRQRFEHPGFTGRRMPYHMCLWNNVEFVETTPRNGLPDNNR